MQKRWTVLVLLAALLALFALPLLSAHESFVLPLADLERIERIQGGLNAFESLLVPMQAFLYVVLLGMFFLLMLSFSVLSRKPWAKRINKFFTSYDEWGIRIVRAVFGFSMVLAGLYQTLFLPDMILWGWFGIALAYLQIGIGFFIIFNYATDAFGLAAIALYIVAVCSHGWRAIDHLDILGMGIYLLCSHHGQTAWLTRALDAKAWSKTLVHHLKANAFDVLRILFGLSLLISGLRYKWLYPEYFLRVVDTFSLSGVFLLDPLFLTLCAGTVEILVGLVLISGIETRIFSAIAIGLFSFMGFLMNESLMGHLVIFAILLLILTHKNRKDETMTLERAWERLLNL